MSRIDVGPPDIPIVGQRFRLLGATLLPMLECGCGKGLPLTLIAQLVSPRQWVSVQSHCQGCGAGYQVQSVLTDEYGTVHITVASTMPAVAATAPATES